MFASVVVSAGLFVFAVGGLALARPRVGGPALLALVILFVWVFWVEPRSLVVNRQAVTVEGLAAPLRLVAIGDPQPTRLHWPPARLRAAFARAQAEAPDLVVWLGDYAYEGGLYERLGVAEAMFVEPADTIAAMAGLTAPLGAFAILGNHDWWWDGPEVARLLEDAGIGVLIDEAVYVEDAETKAALWLVGLDDIATPRVTDLEGALAKTDDRAPVIVLSHSPDIFPRVPRGPALVLSGHTHCGQVRIPLFGRPIAPIEHKRYVCGAHDEGGRRLFVTSGVGTAIAPIRFLTPPEIVVFDLVPAL